MEKNYCQNIYQDYLELESKIRSGVQIVKQGQPYKVLIDSNDINESERLRGGLEKCLEFLSNDELLKIYTDLHLGEKVRAVLKERRTF